MLFITWVWNHSINSCCGWSSFQESRVGFIFSKWTQVCVFLWLLLVFFFFSCFQDETLFFNMPPLFALRTPQGQVLILKSFTPSSDKNMFKKNKKIKNGKYWNRRHGSQIHRSHKVSVKHSFYTFRNGFSSRRISFRFVLTAALL